MPLVAGTVTVTAGVPSGAGLARAMFDATRTSLGIATTPVNQTGLAEMAKGMNALASAIVTYITANATITATPTLAVPLGIPVATTGTAAAQAGATTAAGTATGTVSSTLT